MKQKKDKWSDHYTRAAKKRGMPARSVFKLEEIQNKFRVIRPGNRVLDLGCAPGSWLLFAAKITGSAGQVTGVDLKEVGIRLPANANVLKADARTFELPEDNRLFDVVLSDMAPATSGRKDVDAARSLDLCLTALAIARCLLVKGGAFVCKIFQGPDFQDFCREVDATFAIRRIFRPQSTRKASKEIYIVAMDKR